MTTIVEERAMARSGGFPTAAALSSPESSDGDSPTAKPTMRAARTIVAVVLGLAVVGVCGTAAVVFGIGPLMHARAERSLIRSESAAIDDAAAADQGPFRPPLPSLPPAPGSVVGILTIPALGVQQAVVEGVGPSQTAAGVGHEPGTSGLGQPGNAAVVGRHTGFGAPFANLADLHVGDKVVTATTEGESLYIVRSVRDVTLMTPGTAALESETTTTPATSASSGTPTSGSGGKAGHAGIKESTDKLFGLSASPQLTLVTSASANPWNTSRALVIVARMTGKPFEPTPQESRNVAQQGFQGDTGVLGWLLLALVALLGVGAGAVLVARTFPTRTAYLLGAAPLFVATLLVGDAFSHLIPAWT